jgi:hypothetical protein
MYVFTKALRRIGPHQKMYFVETGRAPCRKGKIQERTKKTQEEKAFMVKGTFSAANTIKNTITFFCVFLVFSAILKKDV